MPREFDRSEHSTMMKRGVKALASRTCILRPVRFSMVQSQPADSYPRVSTARLHVRLLNILLNNSRQVTMFGRQRVFASTTLGWRTRAEIAAHVFAALVRIIACRVELRSAFHHNHVRFV